jgi:uncharacterized protein (UPF0248 family)
MAGNPMIPIHKLLNRLRWDPNFAQSDFALGYYERPCPRTAPV